MGNRFALVSDRFGGAEAVRLSDRVSIAYFQAGDDANTVISEVRKASVGGTSIDLVLDAYDNSEAKQKYEGYLPPSKANGFSSGPSI